MFRPYRFLHSPEVYVARQDDEHYIFWSYRDLKWYHGISLVWAQQKDQAREISWLELLVQTGRKSLAKNNIGISKAVWEDNELTIYFEDGNVPWGAQEFKQDSYTRGVLDTITALCESTKGD